MVLNMKKLVVFTVLTFFMSLMLANLTASASDHIEYDPNENKCVVYPTGSDDTANLFEAFNTVISNGAGATVELVEGNYTISSEVVIVNFDGWFKGAGPDKTIISNIYTEEWPHRNVTYFPEVAGLFLFYQTDESIHNYHFSDLTFKVQGKTYDYYSFTGLNILEVVGRVNGDKEDLYQTTFNTKAENIRFEGQIIDSWHYTNVINPYQIGGEFIITDAWYFKPISGTHQITNCTFYNVGGGPKYNVMNGELEIRNIVIKDCFSGLCIYDPSDIADEAGVVIKGNIITNVKMNAMWLWGSDNMLIKDNIINGSESVYGISLLNGDGNQIIDNNIMGHPGGIALDHSNNNTIVSNIFSDNQIDLIWEGPGGYIQLGEDYPQAYKIHVSNTTYTEAAQLEIRLKNAIAEKEAIDDILSNTQSEVADLTLSLNEAEENIEDLEDQLADTSVKISELEARLDNTVNYSLLFGSLAIVAIVCTGLGYYIRHRR